MEILRSLVQSLIIIVVLSVFLEMLLPQSDLRRYIRLVMGLLVIIAVLQAVGSLVKGEWRLSLPEQAVNHSQQGFQDLNEIMATGSKLNRDQQAQALDGYRQSLARQVSALAGISSEMNVVSADVEIYDEDSGPKFGQVKKITLVLKKNITPAGVKDKSQQSTVKPVEIMGGEGTNTTTEVTKESVDKLKKTISNFYNLSPEQVVVTYSN